EMPRARTTFTAQRKFAPASRIQADCHIARMSVSSLPVAASGSDTHLTRHGSLGSCPDRMPHIALLHETDWDGWRQAARHLVLAGIEPAEVDWSVGGKSEALPGTSGGFNVPRALVALASVAIQAREPERFGLLYSLVWRAQSGERVLEDPTDPDLVLARRLALSVRAEAHRMRTNLRFLPVETD